VSSSTRRGILAAGTVLLAGAAPAAAATASAGPDARLIGLCSEFVAAEAEFRRLSDGDAAAAEFDQVNDLMSRILHQIDALPAAQTLEGWRAKARLLYSVPEYYEPPSGGTESVLWTLIAELAELPKTPDWVTSTTA
jgi:hypothetical protein